MRVFRTALALTLATCSANAAVIAPGVASSGQVDMNGFVETTQPGLANASIQRTITTTGFNVSTEAIANTSFGQWAGYARASGNVNLTGANFLSLGYRGTAYMTVFENFTVAQGSFIEIPVRVTGAVDARASGSSNLPAGSTVAASMQFGMTCQANPFDGVNYLPGSSCSDGATFSAARGFDQEFIVRFAVVPNVLHTVRTQWIIDARLNLLVNGVVTGPFSFAGIAVGDFLHTGVVLPARVLDANGNVIPNVAITSGSGFDYNNPFGGTTAVPEPSFALLAGGGLFAILLGRRRRRS